LPSEYHEYIPEYCINSSDIIVNSSGISMYAGGVTDAIESLSVPITLSMCYNTGNIAVRSTTSSSVIGGISGWEISNTEGNTAISWCYDTGTMSLDSPFMSDIGGIAGSSVCNTDGMLTLMNNYNIRDIYADDGNTDGITDSIHLNNPKYRQSNQTTTELTHAR